MKKIFFVLVVVFTFSFSAKTQTLFTYGNKKADVNEFLQAYHKVYPGNSEEINKEFIWFKHVHSPNTLKDMDDVARAFEKILG